ncbi:hypothetical protein BGX26_001144 [Mortierella sp. AD094]|nr:hypothetical protein BGX26_001144 [Mortierella sp. AD094]
MSQSNGKRLHEAKATSGSSERIQSYYKLFQDPPDVTQPKSQASAVGEGKRLPTKDEGNFRRYRRLQLTESGLNAKRIFLAARFLAERLPAIVYDKALKDDSLILHRDGKAFRDLAKELEEKEPALRGVTGLALYGTYDKLCDVYHDFQKELGTEIGNLASKTALMGFAEQLYSIDTDFLELKKEKCELKENEKKRLREAKLTRFKLHAAKRRRLRQPDTSENQSPIAAHSASSNPATTSTSANSIVTATSSSPTSISSNPATTSTPSSQAATSTSSNPAAAITFSNQAATSASSNTNTTTSTPSNPATFITSSNPAATSTSSNTAAASKLSIPAAKSASSNPIATTALSSLAAALTSSSPAAAAALSKLAAALALSNSSATSASSKPATATALSNLAAALALSNLAATSASSNPAATSTSSNPTVASAPSNPTAAPVPSNPVAASAPLNSAAASALSNLAAASASSNPVVASASSNAVAPSVSSTLSKPAATSTSSNPAAASTLSTPLTLNMHGSTSSAPKVAAGTSSAPDLHLPAEPLFADDPSMSHYSSGSDASFTNDTLLRPRSSTSRATPSYSSRQKHKYSIKKSAKLESPNQPKQSDNSNSDVQGIRDLIGRSLLGQDKRYKKICDQVNSLSELKPILDHLVSRANYMDNKVAKLEQMILNVNAGVIRELRSEIRVMGAQIEARQLAIQDSITFQSGSNVISGTSPPPPPSLLNTGTNLPTASNIFDG